MERSRGLRLQIRKIPTVRYGNRDKIDYFCAVYTIEFMAEDQIYQALEVLRRGGIILYPTDTVWGIGCDATNQAAVKRIYELKQRTDSKAMLVLVDKEVKIDFYVRNVPEIAWQLIEVSDKPLTIIYPEARNLAPNLLAADGSVGIRLTREKFSKQLCERFRKAIVSTSANISGQPGAANFSLISEEIKQGVDYIVQYRQDDTSTPTPSSIIKLDKNGTIQIIRK